MSGGERRAGLKGDLVWIDDDGRIVCHHFHGATFLTMVPPDDSGEPLWVTGRRLVRLGIEEVLEDVPGYWLASTVPSIIPGESTDD